MGLRYRHNVDEQSSGSQLALDLPLSIALGIQDTPGDEPEHFPVAFGDEHGLIGFHGLKRRDKKLRESLLDRYLECGRVSRDGEASGVAPRSDQP